MTHKAPMAGGMALSALATVASFLPYLAIYCIIQEIVGAYPDFGALDVPKVLGYGGMALGGVLLNVLLYTASVALSHMAAYGTLYQCKLNYVSHIAKLPLGYHLKAGSGKLRKIMDDNIESLEGFIAHDLPNMISAFVAPVVMLALVFAVDWRFGLATFSGIIVSFLAYGAAFGGGRAKKTDGGLPDIAGGYEQCFRRVHPRDCCGQGVPPNGLLVQTAARFHQELYQDRHSIRAEPGTHDGGLHRCIQQALSELIKGKTVIMIAHRLSTIRGADRILVVDRGRLVQSGTHEELIAQAGRYRDLWNHYTMALTWKLGA